MSNLIILAVAGSVIFMFLYSAYLTIKEESKEKEQEKEKPEEKKVKVIKHLREITFTDLEELNDLLNADYPEETLIAIVGNVETIEKGQALLKKDFKKITAITCTYEEIKS